MVLRDMIIGDKGFGWTTTAQRKYFTFLARHYFICTEAVAGWKKHKSGSCHMQYFMIILCLFFLQADPLLRVDGTVQAGDDWSTCEGQVSGFIAKGWI